MDTKAIGGKIAKARKRMGISQAQLSQGLFISPQAVGKWERGESLPDIITLNRLAKILGVDLNYFSEDVGAISPEASPARSELQPLSPEAPVISAKDAPVWDFSRGNWADADFSGLKNLHDKFSYSNLQRCKFIGSALSGIQFSGNNIGSCDFTLSDLSACRMKSSNLRKNQFAQCALNDAEFLTSNIGGCDFSGADLSRAMFRRSNLEKNIMTGATLNRTSFVSSSLSGGVFEVRIENCYFENCSFWNLTFRNSRLINTFFKGKSLRRIRFIDCQADRLTYAFLKNGKADLSGVRVVEE